MPGWLDAYLAKRRLVAPRRGNRLVAIHPRERPPAAVQAALEGRAPALEPYAELAVAWHTQASSIIPRYGEYAGWLIASGAIGPGRAMDLACGTGITAQALAKLFRRVLAIDINPHMFRQALANLSDHPNVHCMRADFRCFALMGGFDLAVCSGDSLNYVRSPSELKEIFQCVADALQRRGVFLFDLQSELSFRVASRFVFQFRADALEWFQVFNYDPKTRMDDACVITERGVESHRRIYLSPEDVYLAAKAAGLEMAERLDAPLLRWLGLASQRDFYALRRAS